MIFISSSKSFQQAQRKARGMVLLEVILALVLFVGAAAVLTSALSSSLDAVVRHKRQLHAANLAVSVISEIQLGMRSSTPASNVPFTPPFTNWTSDVVISPISASIGENGLSLVEVVVREQSSGFVYRLAQAVNIENFSTNSTSGESLAAIR